MKIINSCGKRRGCSVTILLPYGKRTINVSTRVLQREYDTKKILSIPNIPLDKKLAA